MTDTITTLIERLKKYDAAYAEGDSPVSDKEYDSLRRKALAMDPGNAYFASVGSDVRGGKEKLPYTMGSLDQIYDQKEWDNWVRTYDQKGKFVIVSDKQDGISAMLIYRHGKLEKAFSRGNGMEGADITRHVRRVPSVPKDLTRELGDAYLAVRAELIMPIATFEAKYAGTFKNPRNMVAGCFNRSTTDDAILSDIQCIAYQVVAYSGIEVEDGSDFHIRSKSEELKLLGELAFRVTPYHKVAVDSINEAGLKKLVADAKATSKTELDGIVVTINRYEDMDSQRKSKTTLNPEHSIKFKVSSDGVVTEVTDVIWNVSKSGFFKPRVEVRPVNMSGVTITYATGFNGKFIHDNGIGPGAKVRITRSGDVIPYITDVVKPAKPKMPHEKYEWSDTGVEVIVADEDHADVKFKQVLSFVETLQVDLLKESTLREVFKKMKFDEDDYEDIISTMFALLPQEWAKLVGANGVKIADSLSRRGANMTPEIFLGAVKHLGFGFGVRKAKALLSQVSFDELVKMSESDIASLDGFDSKTAKNIAEGLPKAVALLESLTDDGYITMVKETKTAELKGLVVVFTGFRDGDLEKAIESAGGKVGSGVSGKTTHLLCVDPTSGSSKLKKAKELGVKLMTPEQFKDEFNL